MHAHTQAESLAHAFTSTHALRPWSLIYIPLAFLLHFGEAINSEPADISCCIYTGEQHTRLSLCDRRKKKKKNKFTSSQPHQTVQSKPSNFIKNITLYCVWGYSGGHHGNRHPSATCTNVHTCLQVFQLVPLSLRVRQYLGAVC